MLVCFCSISQLNVLHFCLRSVFTFVFQGHMKVALSILHNQKPITERDCPFYFCVFSSGGLILDFAVDKYYGIAVFSPVMNGVGGNLVAVQASRLSTALHQLGKPGQVQEKRKFHGCIDTFFGSGIHLFYKYSRPFASSARQKLVFVHL